MSHVKILFAVILLPLLCCCNPHREKPERFRVEVMNGYTPVKNQGRGSSCWIFAMLAAIETEHIGRGDSVNLSPYYVERCLLDSVARYEYFARGRERANLRGTGMRLVNAIERYGLVPYDSYYPYGQPNLNVVAAKVRRTVAGAARAGLGVAMGRAQTVLDAAFGPMPPTIFMYSAEYTPLEFARSVCAPGEYVGLTSFTHHPFNSGFVLELPDNVDKDAFWNIPIDSLTARVVEAVKHHRGVCWEGDISEPGFSFARGTATIPAGTRVSQEARQRAFERYDTTDDHCMAIIGLARDSRGRRYFVMKNSWGTGNPYGGLMYMSEDYFRLKTIAVFLSRTL